MNWRCMLYSPVSVLRLLLPARTQAYHQICPRAEHAAVAGHDYAFHPVVHREVLVGFLKLAHHGICKGIVRFRAVEREDYDWGDGGGV